MKPIPQVLLLACAFATAMAQEPPRDCSVGHLDIGGPAPRITSAEYERGRSAWFHVDGARHYKSLVTYGRQKIFEQYVAIDDGRLLAVIREFAPERMSEIVAELRARYGAATTPIRFGPDRDHWIEWGGASDEQSHLAWSDPACGIRVDAFQVVDTHDPRSVNARAEAQGVVVWTKGNVGPPGTAAGDAIR